MLIDKVCPICCLGKLVLKIGKYGAFIGCNKYPICENTVRISTKVKLNKSQKRSRIKSKHRKRYSVIKKYGMV